MNIADLSVTEAASKALELINYGYQTRYSPVKSYVDCVEQLAADYDLDDNPPYDFDIDRVWQDFHSVSATGTYDGLTGKVEKSHGGEGKGDQYYMVISLSDGKITRYFRRDGWYASHDGGYLDGETLEVAPVERLVTFYE